jgi:hypothetical protein
MQYMLMIYADPAGWAGLTPAEREGWMGQYRAYTKMLVDAGVMRGGEELANPDTATTVTMQNGVRRVQDGPFVTSKEGLGGFFLIEVPDLDAALGWAEKCPGAHHGHVEVRPVIVNR